MNEHIRKGRGVAVRRWISRITAIVLFLSLSGCSGEKKEKTVKVSSEPLHFLEQGWRLACAITNDEDDMAKAQEQVADVYIELERPGRAAELGKRIANWRSGVIMAEVASWFAERGGLKQAEKFVGLAEEVVSRTTGWQADRLHMHITQVHAMLARQAEIASAEKTYRGNDTYAGRITAYEALSLARLGNVSQAMKALDDLESVSFFDVMVWRTKGYLLLSESGKLDSDRRREALDKAEASAKKVPGWKKWELLAKAAVARGRRFSRQEAEERFSVIVQEILESPLPGHIKAPLLGRMLADWSGLGACSKWSEIFNSAAEIIESNDLQNIERPSAWALLAEASAELGKREKAEEIYRKAAGLALKLHNPRPRALAGVDICVSLARSGFMSEAVKGDIERLIGSFDVKGSD